MIEKDENFYMYYIESAEELKDSIDNFLNYVYKN